MFKDKAYKVKLHYNNSMMFYIYLNNKYYSMNFHRFKINGWRGSVII